MTCNEFVDRLLVYYEDSEDPSAPSSRQVLESHAAGCPDCRNFLRTYEATIKVGTELYSTPLPDHVQEAIERRIHDAILAETA